jgi:hypothetical protein
MYCAFGLATTTNHSPPIGRVQISIDLETLRLTGFGSLTARVCAHDRVFICSSGLTTRVVVDVYYEDTFSAV